MNQHHHHRGAPRVPPPPRAVQQPRLPLRTVVIFGVFVIVLRYQSGCTTTTTRAAFLVVPQQKWMRHTSHNELGAVVSNQKKNLPNTGGNRPTNNNNKKKNDNNNNESPSLSRRQLVEASVGVLGLGGSFLASRENNEDDYGLWGILPVGPYKTKPTAPIETIVPHTLWTADQIFGILNVQVPLRMTIVKLKLPSRSHDDDTNLPKRMRIPSQQRYLHDNDYCLFIYNPIAPTRECIRMIQQIEQEEQCHVRHISVGSVALEHKVYAASMGQAFRYSTLWLTPGQYTFPLQIPEAPYLGFPTGGRTKMIPRTNPDLNNDNKQDVICTGGWWEQPAQTDGKTAWAFHPANLGDACADMFAFDVDNDGKTDVISTSAHKFGVWWYKQRPINKEANELHPVFEKIELFGRLASETHAAHLVDIDGDGNKDLVTGKRWYRMAVEERFETFTVNHINHSVVTCGG